MRVLWWWLSLPLTTSAWSCTPSRRVFVGSLLIAQPARAAYRLDPDTGDYVEVDEGDWQTAWKSRLDKASAMTTDEIFLAAKGAGNRSNGEPESPAAQKRRALAGCRDKQYLQKSGTQAKECTARVLNGEVDFMLKAMDEK